MGSLCAFLVVRSISRGQFATAVVALGGCALFFGMLIPPLKVRRGKVTPRGDLDDAGTTIRPDRSIDIPVHVALLGGVVASALISVLVALGKLDIPVPPSARYSIPFMSAVVVAMGTPMLWRNLRRGSSKYLRLTPEGFEIAQEWRPQGGEWAQIVHVTNEAPDQTKPTPGTIAVIMSDGSTAAMAAGACTPEGRALRELVRFYWQHPDHRDELTDGRAIRRLADEQFTA